MHAKCIQERNLQDMYREKLKKLVKKKTTIRGHCIQKTEREDGHAILLLSDIYIGHEYICDHLNIYTGIKRVENIEIGDEIIVQARINKYTTKKRKDKFLVSFSNYGVDKIYKISKIPSEEKESFIL